MSSAARQSCSGKRYLGCIAAYRQHRTSPHHGSPPWPHHRLPDAQRHQRLRQTAATIDQSGPPWQPPQQAAPIAVGVSRWHWPRPDPLGLIPSQEKIDDITRQHIQNTYQMTTNLLHEHSRNYPDVIIAPLSQPIPAASHRPDGADRRKINNLDKASTSTRAV